MGEPDSVPDGRLLAMRIIIGALTVGVAFFVGIAIFVRAQGHMPPPPAVPRAPSLRASCRSAFEAWIAGARPKMMPVPTATASVKTSTRQSTPAADPFSPRRGRPAVLIDSSARIARPPKASPSAPPASDRTTLSASS